MNKEILFRGKVLESNDWVYGNYVLLPKRRGVFGQVVSDLDRDKHIIVDKFGNSHEIVSQSIGQFTGMSDRNGKKIFEGDLLKGFDFPFMGDGVHGYFAEVVHLVDAPAYALRMRRNPQAAVMGNWEGVCDRYFLCSGFDSNSWEIIGNVFDNQELLKAQPTKVKKETKQKKGYEYNKGVIAGAQALVDKAKEKHMPIITLDNGTFYAVKESVLDDALKRISEEYKC